MLPRIIRIKESISIDHLLRYAVDDSNPSDKRVEAYRELGRRNATAQQVEVLWSFAESDKIELRRFFATVVALHFKADYSGIFTTNSERVKAINLLEDEYDIRLIVHTIHARIALLDESVLKYMDDITSVLLLLLKSIQLAKAKRSRLD